jgi:hypothetical protein
MLLAEALANGKASSQLQWLLSCSFYHVAFRLGLDNKDKKRLKLAIPALL